MNHSLAAMLLSETTGIVPVKAVTILHIIESEIIIVTGCLIRCTFISPFIVLNVIMTSMTASISSVGRKRSTDVSGIRNLNCIERGTRNTVRIRNLSIESTAKQY